MKTDIGFIKSAGKAVKVPGASAHVSIKSAHRKLTINL